MTLIGWLLRPIICHATYTMTLIGWLLRPIICHVTYTMTLIGWLLRPILSQMTLVVHVVRSQKCFWAVYTSVRQNCCLHKLRRLLLHYHCCRVIVARASEQFMSRIQLGISRRQQMLNNPSNRIQKMGKSTHFVIEHFPPSLSSLREA